MHHFSKICLAAITVFASVALPSFADSTPPKHSCVKPDHPGALASEARMKGFQKEVNDFRDCINKFANEQKVFSENHMTAGNSAVNEFNTFVKNELTPKKEDEPAK